MKKALVVDDTKNIRIILTTCLELEGYEVSTAYDGKEALALFNQEKFDLAFIDIKMPEISGTEVLRRIRDIGIITPVIIITAFPTVKNAVECTKMGAVAYLQKPFTADKLRNVLKEMTVDLAMGLNDIDVKMEYIRQIKALINERLFHEALIILKKTIAIDPTDPEIYLLFSKVFEELDNNEYCIKFMRIYEALKK